jgi:ATP-dependent DNA helicase RecG
VDQTEPEWMNDHELVRALLDRIRLGEDSETELKRLVWRGHGKVAEPHPDAVSDELAAMANADGGMLILGIDDRTREVLGIAPEDLDAAERWLVSICTDRIVPPLDVNTRHLELPTTDGELRPVLVVSVPRSLWVHQSANGYFRRVGHSKRPLTPDALARLFQQRSQARLIRFEEQDVPESSVNDVDPLLARPYLREGEGTAEDQLRRLHLLGSSTRLTVAGALLLTLRPTRFLPSAMIQAVAYSGVNNDPADQVDAKDFDGPLPQQVWSALDFVQLHNRVGASKGPGRSDRPDYSTRAVFEAVVNAVAHRDYSQFAGRIRLHMFADRLELYSPGALPNSMTVESMTRLSLPRNDVLAGLFARFAPVRDSGLGREFLMDRRGAGVDVILRESLALSGRNPRYENLSDIDLLLTIYSARP